MTETQTALIYCSPFNLSMVLAFLFHKSKYLKSNKAITAGTFANS